MLSLYHLRAVPYPAPSHPIVTYRRWHDRQAHPWNAVLQLPLQAPLRMEEEPEAASVLGTGEKNWTSCKAFRAGLPNRSELHHPTSRAVQRCTSPCASEREMRGITVDNNNNNNNNGSRCRRKYHVPYNSRRMSAVTTLDEPLQVDYLPDQEDSQHAQRSSSYVEPLSPPFPNQT